METREAAGAVRGRGARKRLIYVGPSDWALRWRARYGVCRRQGHTPFWYDGLGIFCYRCHRRVAPT